MSKLGEFFSKLLKGRFFTREQYVNDFLTGKDIAAEPRKPILGGDVGEQQALALSAFYAAVTIIAESIASEPPVLVKEDGLTPAKREREYKLFDEAPNSTLNPQQYIESEILDTVINGNCFAEMTRDDSGHVVAMWPYRPDAVSVYRKGEMILFKTSADGQGQPFAPGSQRVMIKGYDGFHFFRYSRNYITGLNPLQYHAELMGLQRAQEEYQATLFERGVMTRGVLKAPINSADLSDEQIDNLKAQFRAAYTGVANGGTAIVLPGGYEYVPTSMTPADAELIQNYNLSERKIASIFKIPLFMLQNHEYSTFSNIEELGIGFVKNCLKHWSSQLCAAKTQQILTQSQRDKGLHFVQNLDHLKEGKLKERFEAATNGVMGGWLLRSEARAMANLQNVPGMEKPLSPLSLATEEERQAKIEATKKAGEAKTQPANEEKPPKSVNNGDKSQNSAENLAKELFSDAIRRLSVKVEASIKAGKTPIEAVDAHWAWFKNQTKIVTEHVENDPDRRDFLYREMKFKACAMAEAGQWETALVLNSKE